MAEENRRSLRLDLRHIAPPKIEPSFLKPKPGKLQFPNGEQYEFTAADLLDEQCIGVGAYGGIVARMVHAGSGQVMAVKRVRAQEVDTKRREAMLRELRIIIQSQNCEDIVRFYGALFHSGDCWICMELMDCSLDKFYPLVYDRGESIPERVIGTITASVVRALNYLKEKLNIIHRDVKPSNILLDRRGFVKLCDFGISGELVDSMAKTLDCGCQIYMAPERLMDGKQYDIRSDVWSLGITLVEICIGRFPYTWKTIFDQLQAVVHGDPPFLTASAQHTWELVDFVNQCLIKDMEQRPKFRNLMEHSFFVRHNNGSTEVGGEGEAGKEMAEERRAQMGAYVDRFLREEPPTTTTMEEENKDEEEGKKGEATDGEEEERQKRPV